MKQPREGIDMAVRMSLAVLAVVALLAIAGCGGSDSSGTSSQASTSSESTAGATSPQGGDTTSSGPSEETTTSETAESEGGTNAKAVLIKNGDAICRSTDELQRAQLAAYEKKHPKSVSTPAGEEKTLVIVALPPIAAEIEELADLGAPQGDEATMTQFLSELEKNLKAAEGDPSKLLGLGNPFESADKIAVKYGFKDCAKAE